MIALYFSAFPEDADGYYKEVMDYQIEEDKRQENLERNLIDFIKHLKKDELENLLLEILYNGPEWQYEKFIQMYIE